MEWRQPDMSHRDSSNTIQGNLAGTSGILARSFAECDRRQQVIRISKIPRDIIRYSESIPDGQLGVSR